VEALARPREQVDGSHADDVGELLQGAPDVGEVGLGDGGRVDEEVLPVRLDLVEVQPAPRQHPEDGLGDADAVPVADVEPHGGALRIEGP
jgi:hypothetical protein